MNRDSKKNARNARLRFSEVPTEVGRVPGYYEIWTLAGELLKVGIAGNLRKRLTHHGQSVQRGLKAVNGKTVWSDPSEVSSKRSILAKHLYFDALIGPRFDLRCEAGRQRFLEQGCRIYVRPMPSREAARELERKRERAGGIRYAGLVITRKTEPRKRARRPKAPP